MRESGWAMLSSCESGKNRERQFQNQFLLTIPVGVCNTSPLWTRRKGVTIFINVKMTSCYPHSVEMKHIWLSIWKGAKFLVGPQAPECFWSVLQAGPVAGHIILWNNLEISQMPWLAPGVRRVQGNHNWRSGCQWKPKSTSLVSLNRDIPGCSLLDQFCSILQINIFPNAALSGADPTGTSSLSRCPQISETGICLARAFMNSLPRAGAQVQCSMLRCHLVALCCKSLELPVCREPLSQGLSSKQEHLSRWETGCKLGLCHGDIWSLFWSLPITGICILQ